MTTKNFLVCVAGLAMVAGVANAGLITTRTTTGSGATVDGTLGANEYGPGNFNNYLAGGSGFGSTLGLGFLCVNSDATNLYIGFQPGNNLNDLVSIQIDSKAGGFTDATSNDTADGGRRAASNLNGQADDAFPTGFLSDYSIVIGNFGIVTFEHTGGASLNFIDFNGTFTGNGTNFREYTLPLAALGITSGFNFFAGYVADSGFGSNESLPAGAINSGSNVGDGTSSPGYENFHRFEIPAPSSIALLGLAGLAAARRRRA